MKLLIPLILSLLLIAGCNQAAAEQQEAAQISFFAMDTMMDFSVNQGEAQILEQLQTIIFDLEARLSLSNPTSELSLLNQNGQAKLSAETAALIEQALELCSQTQGALDISIYPLVQAWGFISDNYYIPTEAELAAILPYIDYRQIELNGQQISLKEGMQIDLGAVAKGYSGDLLIELLKEEGYTSAILNLGGNVHTLGLNPEGQPWQVAVQDPTQEGYIGILAAQDEAIITSGGYQRYFSDLAGNTYGHILNPASGLPVQNDLLSVTIIGEQGLKADALSTALFVMGLDEAIAYWQKYGGFEAVFIAEDNTVYITPGLEPKFTLIDEENKWQLEVIHHD